MHRSSLLAWIGFEMSHLRVKSALTTAGILSAFPGCVRKTFLPSGLSVEILCGIGKNIEIFADKRRIINVYAMYVHFVVGEDENA